ncbi:small-subunit processome [Dipodascopsis uninucleata]
MASDSGSDSDIIRSGSGNEFGTFDIESSDEEELLSSRDVSEGKHSDFFASNDHDESGANGSDDGADFDNDSDSNESYIMAEENEAIEEFRKAIKSHKNAPEEKEYISNKRRRLLAAQAELAAIAEQAEQDAPPPSKKITLDDIRSLGSTGAAARSLARLDELENRAAKKSGKTSSEIVKSRLGRRLEQRIDRAAAYDIAKSEVSKWQETVKVIREAENLQFPLQATNMNEGKPGLASAIDDLNEHVEAKVENALLQRAEEILGEDYNEELIHADDLEVKKMTLEEVVARRNELRRMREMMFREERKAKRIKKIKSKMYRKVHKRARERERELLEQLNDEGDGDDESKDYEKLVQRAKERMSLKHKSTSKWARDVKHMNLHKDKGTRDEIEAMLRLNEELTRKIDGREDSDLGQSDSDDGSVGLEELEVERDNDNDASSNRIMAMKFMRDAESRLRRQNEDAIAETRVADDSYEEEDSGDPTSSVVQVINEGRRKYAPGAAEAKVDAAEAVKRAEEDNEGLTGIQRKLDQLKDIPRVSSATTIISTESAGINSIPENTTANPWIKDVHPSSITRNGALQNLSKDSTRDVKAVAKLKRTKRRNNNKMDKDIDVNIDVNQILEIHDVYDDNDNMETSGVNDFDVTMISKNSRAGNRRTRVAEFKQRELVKRAFAGDDVVTEFQMEKQQVIEDEGDKEIDVTLPGWGAWTGKGTRKNSQRRIVEKIKGIAPEKRQDSKLKNVIINEKTAKKSAKYTAGHIPFPYESREQYERALRMPIGKEWTTQTTTQKLTKPRIIIKPGVVIDPLKTPFAA